MPLLPRWPTLTPEPVTTMGLLQATVSSRDYPASVSWQLLLQGQPETLKAQERLNASLQA